ncbi:uncharacterized protein HaLaN_24143, partial [Haematococcus lacustris]
MLTCFQTSTVSSAMFITAMAANPLAVNLAATAGINISWGTWALAGAAHIGAMYTAFLAVAIKCGTPPMLAAVALGQLSNLMGCLTTTEVSCVG